MTRDACKEIFQKFPENSIVHMKTRNGDKICIKDNSKTSTNKISSTIHDEYLEISVVNASDKKVSCTNVYIVFEDIIQFELKTT